MEQRLVAPFYLSMMGANALTLESDERSQLVRVSTTATVGEVRQLLGSGWQWRPLVMGTWFALALPSDEIRDDVVAAMTSAAGGLTAPPLAAVSALLADGEAIGAMRTYAEWIADPIRRDGSYELVSAAIAHLGGTPPVGPSSAAMETFQSLYQRADDLRHAFRTAREGLASP
jgi:hypothetical protein